MPTREPRDYFRTRSALSDWLTAAAPESRTTIIGEDFERSRRLARLHELTGFPILETRHFTGAETVAATPRFQEFADRATGSYALRAVHRDDREHVFRNRNLPLPDLLRWLQGKVADITDFDLEFSPHLANEWSTIFVVTGSGVIAEVVRGSLRQLTQGEHLADGPVRVTYDYARWAADPPDPRALALARTAIGHASVGSAETRDLLRRELGCEFADGTYLRGYFEAIFGPADDIRFIDFNMSMGAPLEESYVELIRGQQGVRSGELHGLTASRGRTAGTAHVLVHDEGLSYGLNEGEILVCGEPTPDMIPLLARASGVVMERGGLLTHASVVCRELRIPCLVGTANATEVIPDGARVDLDADAGVVRVLS
jgi:phosphohistidine swiveling domain-containing protein